MEMERKEFISIQLAIVLLFVVILLFFIFFNGSSKEENLNIENKYLKNDVIFEVLKEL